MKIISLFCGCGGFDLGMVGGFSYLGESCPLTGHEVIFANDINKNACLTYAKNIGEHVICKDVREIKEFPPADILIGGYPCQGFSIIGTRLVTDERNFLYIEYARCLEQVKPKVFIAENVKGLLSIDRGKVLGAMLREFEQKGYRVTYKLLDAKDYGVPQDRERVFIVGVREGFDFQYAFPESKHIPPIHIRQLNLFPKDGGEKLYVTLRDALAGLQEPSEEELYKAGFSPLYKSRNRRRGWDDVSFTIQAGSMHVPLHPSSPPMEQVGKDAWEFGKRGSSRRLTVRECKRVQSFPDGFEIVGKGFATQYRQIGNAVPPVLVWHLAKNIPRKIE